MTYFIFILFIFVLVVVFSIVRWSVKNGIGPMPTSPKAKSVLLNNLPSHWQGIIYELGSGWGTLAFPLAKKYPNCTVIACENSPVPYFITRLRLCFSRHKNLHLKRQDFFNQDLRRATMIVCYLYPAAMQKLKKKFENELTNETLVISNTFSILGWPEHKIYEVRDMYHSKIYVYVVSKKDINDVKDINDIKR